MFYSTRPKSIIPLTVKTILQHGLIIDSGLLTMRTVSSLPLVGHRLGLIRRTTLNLLHLPVRGREQQMSAKGPVGPPAQTPR
jgi:hypothetical protein